jgi:uncharacterized protein YndB with AHSA1/START domain
MTTIRTLTIAPVRKSVVVNADAATAFAVFTADLDRWWPKSHHIGASPIRQSVFEPFVGGRWYTKCEDGSEVGVGRVRIWEPGQRLVFSWDINSEWKPDTSVASEVEISFVAEGPEVTRVNVEHRHFEAMGETGGNKMRSEVDGGWPGLLALYAQAVDNRGSK